jgi:hypothetical protein
MQWLFQAAATRAALAAAVAACESMWQTNAAASTDMPMTEGQSPSARLDQNESRDKASAPHGHNAVNECSGESPSKGNELTTKTATATESLAPTHLAAANSSIIGVDHDLLAAPFDCPELETVEPYEQGDHPALAGPAVDPLAVVEMEANAALQDSPELDSSRDTVGESRAGPAPTDHALNNWEPLPQELEALK